MGSRQKTTIWRASPVLLVGAVACALFQAPAAVADLVYKYRDANGNITYTDQKIGTDYEVLDFRTKGWVDRSNVKANVNFARNNREKYRPMVDQASEDSGLSPELLHAVIAVESSYNSRAVSPAGAMGLMQLMPGTASRYGVKDAFNAEDNIRGGTRYLQDLMAMFNGDLKLVLAAYNAGEGAVEKYGRAIPPYVETQKYVRKVLEHYKLLLQQQLTMR